MFSLKFHDYQQLLNEILYSCFLEKDLNLLALN